MQSINGIREQLRTEIEELDGGYTAVAKEAKKTLQHIRQALQQPDRRPRLATLEEIRAAVDVVTARENKRRKAVTA